MTNNNVAMAECSAVERLELYTNLKFSPGSAVLWLAITFAFMMTATTANAAVFTVSNTSNSGAGSLRQAVLDANANPGADSIAFSPTIFNQLQVITLQGEIPVTQELQINGSTGRQVWISGSGAGRIFNVTNANLEVSNIMLVSGSALNQGNGGAILVNGGTTTVLNSTFYANNAFGDGGAIYVQSGTLNVNNATFYGNTAQNGAGIYVDGASSTANIVSCSFAGNSVNNTGGGLRTFGAAAVSLRNSAFGSNIGSQPDIAGAVTSLGYNMISNTAGAVISGTTTGNQLNVNPQFAAFNDYGGKTWTLAIQPTSPAIDAGDPSQAAFTDQRGTRRNTDGNTNGVAGVDIGAFEQQRSAFDVEGDGSADLAVTRSEAGNFTWFGGFRQVESRPEMLSPTPNRLSVVTFGLSTDVQAPADYDGDGRMDPAVFRPTTGIWYIQRSTLGFAAMQWGLAGDVPVPADYDGDGKADIAVFRNGEWFIFGSNTGYTGSFQLGASGYFAVPADYDGDLKADPAVFFNGTWIVKKSTGGQLVESFGVPNDVPVPADYDGNGSANLAVFRPVNGTWYITRPSGGYDAAPFGLATDKLVPGDYDGDGKVDIAVWRANTNSNRGEWYINQSRDGFILANFGFSTDYPVASARVNP